MTQALPPHGKLFGIRFKNGNLARAIRVKQDENIRATIAMLGFTPPQPVIFISGGAGQMEEEDQRHVASMMSAVAAFAQERGAFMVDGGTEAGVMQMVGEMRGRHQYRFPLIGVSPIGKVSFPGYENPNEEAQLEDHHSHFVLVEGENWGDESTTIMNLAHALCGDGRRPAVGILINGGKIALHEVFLATTKDKKLSMIVLEGTGRAADEISTAFKTGQASRMILNAILKVGDIQIVATVEGPQKLLEKLQAKFDK